MSLLARRRRYLFADNDSSKIDLKMRGSKADDAMLYGRSTMPCLTDVASYHLAEKYKWDVVLCG